MLVFGHTHLPYAKEVAGVLLVNDGSMGKSKDRDARSGYVLLEVGEEVKIEANAPLLRRQRRRRGQIMVKQAPL